MTGWYPKLLNYLNGKWLENDKCLVSVNDEGFLSGTSVYETLRTYSGIIFGYEQHLMRLKHSAEAFSIEIPVSEQFLSDLIHKGIENNRIKEAYVRVQLTLSGTLFIFFKELPTANQDIYKNGVKIGISSVRRNPVLYNGKVVKTTASSDVFMARSRFDRKNFYEMLMLSPDGFVAEGTFSNVFIIKNETVITPSLDTGILDGVTRKKVIEHIKQMNEICLLERKIEVSELFECDEIFLTHTSAGIVPVSAICSIQKNNHKTTNLLKNEFI